MINDSIIEDETNEEFEDDRQNLIAKADLQILNNGWNDKNEQLIISIGENASAYKWMHEQNAIYQRTMQNTFSIILILLSTILSAITIFPNDLCFNGTPLDIVQRVFTYSITLLSVLQTYIKPQELCEKHLQYAHLFSVLYHDIQKQMCMYRRSRTNSTKLVTKYLTQYDSLVIKGPHIDNYIVSKFKKTFRDSNLLFNLQHIEIISENTTPIVQQSLGQPCNNLKQVHNLFQIHGDISDNDIQNANSIELKELRKKFVQEKSTYEYNRYLEHNLSDD